MKRRQEVYEFIINYFKIYGYSPTYREIAEGVGVKSTSTVNMHLQYLIKDGKITTKEGEPRTIKLLEYELVKRV